MIEPDPAHMDAAALPAGEAWRGLSARVPSRAALAATLSRLRASGDLWYLIAAVVVNVANFGFFGLVGHLLRPSAYGAAAALLNVVSIAAIPLNAVQAAVVQETVIQTRDGVIPDVRRAAIGFTAVSGLVTLVVAAGSPLLAGFFGLSGLVPLLLLALWFAPAISSSLYDGVLIGALRWRAVAVSLIAGAVVRVLVEIGLGAVAPNINAPVLATLLNALVTLAVVIFVLYREHPGQVRPVLRLRAAHVSPTVAALTGYSVMVAADTILARHILSPGSSGRYAAAVTIGRIALFAPTMLTTIVFPRFVAAHQRGADERRLLLVSLTAVLGLGLAIAGVLALVSTIALTLLFGHRYDGAHGLVGVLSLEGALLAATGLVTYFHLARRSRFAALPAVTIVVVAAGVLVWRPSARDLAWTMVTADLVCLTLMTAAALLGGDRLPSLHPSSRAQSNLP